MHHFTSIGLPTKHTKADAGKWRFHFRVFRVFRGQPPLFLAPVPIPFLYPGRARRWVRGVIGAVLGVSALLVLAWLALPWVPLPRGLREPAASIPRIELLDRHGTPLRILPGTDGLVARELAESDIPRTVIDTTLAAEDARFFHHAGVDPIATLRAAGQWVRHRRIVSGASTITQQLVKLAEPRPRTLRTKFIEAVESLALEREWDKPRILRAYLARIDYGNRCAGLTEATHHYFGKQPRDLDLAEAAFLAGLPQAPTRLNPRLRYSRAKIRQEWILGRCLALGWITASDHDRAVAEEIRLIPPQREFSAPHFVDMVLAQPSSQPPSEGRAPKVPFPKPAFPQPPGSVGDSYNSSLRTVLPTTLDLPLQTRCEEIVHAQLAGLRAVHVQDAAVIVLHNPTGELLALVGSGDWSQPGHGQVNGALARRSPGSALKPFTYLLAFTDGATAADIVADVPAEFPTPTGIFRPMNYTRHCRGPVSLREALANSLNIPAVRTLATHGGPARLQSLLLSCGLTTLDRATEDYGLGLTLGDAEVRLLELSNAYATLARLGEWRPVRWFAGATPAVSRRVAAPDVCWLIADILQDPAARAAGFGLETPLRFDFPVACKTGTSSGFRDNWAFGYTPEFTVGVWAGNFDGSPMSGVSGVVGAAPILQDIFHHLHAIHGTGWFAPPIGIETAWVHPLTGHRVHEGSGGHQESFVRSTLPPWASEADCDPQGRVRLPAEYTDWLGSADNRLGDSVVLDDAGKARELRILCPLPGTILYLDGDLPESAQRLSLRASKACAWRCSTLALEEIPGRTEARLIPGRHRLEAIGSSGRMTAETWIEVRRL